MAINGPEQRSVANCCRLDPSGNGKDRLEPCAGQKANDLALALLIRLGPADSRPASFGSQVAGLSIDLCCLCSLHRVGAGVGRIKPNALHSAVHDACVLTGGQMWASPEPAGEEKSIGSIAQRRAGRLCDLELDWSASLLLDDGGAFADAPASFNVTDTKRHQITSPEFAVDRQIEEGEVPCQTADLKPYPDGPDVLRPQWPLLSDDQEPTTPTTAPTPRRHHSLAPNDRRSLISGKIRNHHSSGRG